MIFISPIGSRFLHLHLHLLELLLLLQLTESLGLAMEMMLPWAVRRVEGGGNDRAVDWTWRCDRWRLLHGKRLSHRRGRQSWIDCG